MTDKVYIGDLKICTLYKEKVTYKKEELYGIENLKTLEYEEKIFKKNATLLKISEKYYLDLDDPKALEILIKIALNKQILSKKKDFLIPSLPYHNHIFVDESSLKKYIEEPKILTKTKKMGLN